MAEKKTTSKAKTTAKKTTTKKAASKNVTAKKATTKKAPVKETKVVDTYANELKKKKDKKENKIKKWFNNLTVEKILIYGFILLAILLIILIGVATKNTKTTDGKDIVISVKGKTLTADELYKELKKQNGCN